MFGMVQKVEFFEKRKAQEVSQQIRDKREGKPKLTILEALEDNESFWKTLGGKPSKDKLPAATPDDEKKLTPNHCINSVIQQVNSK